MKRVGIVCLAALALGLTPASSHARALFDPLATVVHFSPSVTGIYLGSPALVRLDNGDLLAGMDLFGPGAPKPTVSLIFRSRDGGKTWRHVTDIRGSFWANLFPHRGALYYFGVSDQDGAVVIRRSDDDGETWTEPVDERRGLLLPLTEEGRYHCAPMPVLKHEGRLYRAFENNPERRWPDGFRAFVLSADADADLLKAASWVKSNEIAFDPATAPPGYAEGAEHLPGGRAAGWLEGNVVPAPDGRLLNILRVNSLPVVDQAAVMEVHDAGRRLTFDPETGFVGFPGGMSKFAIRLDETTGRYWTITNGNTNPRNPNQRNVLSLYSSADLVEWTHHDVLLEDRDDHDNVGYESKAGFQYIEFHFDGEDIIFLSRTAFRSANNYHDANYMTFHRIERFRERYGVAAGPRVRTPCAQPSFPP